jgi:Alginate lyase
LLFIYFSRYFWRNPDTPDGLPYIRKDGYVNPEVETVQDYRLLRQMLREVYRLGLAFQLTGNETYAVKASDRLYEWFVNPETKMNPHFHWGSLRKGNTHGSRTGILDMYPIYRVRKRL